ncbi:MAG TPA: type II toxin-antitoxin system VapC family toxin [Vicinamibacteria bacterium]|nr:type II toxin-antitoxin system VapC family toxin [Vicinamibacteria bacterium]
MILDSSAIAGVVLREPGFETLVSKVAQAEALAVGAPTLAEAGIVLTARLGRDTRGLLQGLLREWDAATVAFGEEHWREAVSAYDRFGRGRHEARLNFGDCMAYAVAKLADEPLLCTGGDFAKTDLKLA